MSAYDSMRNLLFFDLPFFLHLEDFKLVRFPWRSLVISLKYDLSQLQRLLISSSYRSWFVLSHSRLLLMVSDQWIWCVMCKQVFIIPYIFLIVVVVVQVLAPYNRTVLILVLNFLSGVSWLLIWVLNVLQLWECYPCFFNPSLHMYWICLFIDDTVHECRSSDMRMHTNHQPNQSSELPTHWQRHDRNYTKDGNGWQRYYRQKFEVKLSVSGTDVIDMKLMFVHRTCGIFWATI